MSKRNSRSTYFTIQKDIDFPIAFSLYNKKRTRFHLTHSVHVIMDMMREKFGVIHIPIRWLLTWQLRDGKWIRINTAAMTSVWQLWHYLQDKPHPSFRNALSFYTHAHYTELTHCSLSILIELCFKSFIFIMFLESVWLSYVVFTKVPQTTNWVT